jgi:hypothetical protein
MRTIQIKELTVPDLNTPPLFYDPLSGIRLIFLHCPLSWTRVQGASGNFLEWVASSAGAQPVCVLPDGR